MSTQWSTATKNIVGIGMALFGLYVLYIIGPVITMLIIASLMAFVLTPVISFFQFRLKMPRLAAVLLAYLLLILLILLSPLLLLPPIIDGYNTIADIDYQSEMGQIINWLQETLLHLKTAQLYIFSMPVDLSGLADPILKQLQEAGTTPLTLPSFETMFNSFTSAATVTFGVATSVAGTVFSGVLTTVFTFFYAIYISLDSHKFGPWFLRLVPKPYRPEVASLLSRLRRIWRAYFRGQLILMLTIGIVIWLGTMTLGLKGAVTLGVIAGLLEVLPGFGPFLAAIPAVLLALIQGSTYLPVSNLIFALIIILLYWGVQQIENNLIVPRVLGGAVELHPLVVMVGLVVGTSVGGILGALLAAPVIASTREITSYLYAKILNEDPFPSLSEALPSAGVSWSSQIKALLRQIWPASKQSTPPGSKESPLPESGENETNQP